MPCVSLHVSNRVLQLLDNLNRQELSMDMWALSKLQLEPGDQWLDEYFDATESQLSRFALRVCFSELVSATSHGESLSRMLASSAEGVCMH
jgi:hypothetical protein